MSADPNYAPALGKAKLALATLPTLPHTTRKTSAPVAEQADPIVAKGSPYLIDLTAFWTAPGDAIDAISYLKTHRPPRTGTSPGMYSGPIGHTRITHKNDPETLTYAVPSPTNPLIVTFDVVAFGADVAVRADVEVRWHATKPTREYLGTVSSVDILMLRPGAGTDDVFSAPTVRRTLTGTQAQTLANAVDATPIKSIFDTSCPGGGTGASDDLVFHTVSRTVQVQDSVDNCGGISVSIGREQQPRLGGSINLVLVQLLGLPSKYDR